MPAEKVIFDFSDPTQIQYWQAINDVVMGGVSQGALHQDLKARAVFSGEVSLAHGGGFASVRATMQAMDLSTFSGMRLYVQGDGKRYKFSLKCHQDFDGIVYQASFQPPSGMLTAIDLPFASFKPTYRGRLAEQAKPLAIESIHAFGLLISEKQAGAFRLEMAKITAII